MTDQLPTLPASAELPFSSEMPRRRPKRNSRGSNGECQPCHKVPIEESCSRHTARSELNVQDVRYKRNSMG